MVAAIANGGTLSMRFKTFPTGTGTYKIVRIAKANNEMEIAAGSTATPIGYATTGSDNVSATVTFNNGKMTVAFPDTWAKAVNGTDSVQISANVTQQ